MRKKAEFKYKSVRILSLMVIITIATQILTLLKSSVIAARFGASEMMDAFYLANNIVSFLFGIISSGITTIIISEYVTMKNRKTVDGFITFIYTIIISFSLLIIAFRYPLIKLMTDKSSAFVTLSGSLLVILAISGFFNSFTGITTAYFQCHDMYNVPKIVNLIIQLIIVVALFILDELNIYTYTLIIALGMIVTFILDGLIAFKKGWRYSLNFKFNNPGVKALIYLFLPIVFSGGIYQLSLMVDSTIASRLNKGQLTVLSYSGQIVAMINTLLIGSLLIYIFPKIVEKINEERNQEIFWKQTTLFHLIVCVIVAGFVVIGKESIGILFGRGKMDGEAIRYIYVCAAIYIFGQQFNIIRDMIYKYFYAKKETKIPMINSMLVSAVNIVASVVLVRILGLYGIVIGTVIASFVSLIRIMFVFRKKWGFETNIFSICLAFIKNIALMVLTIITVLFTKEVCSIQNTIIAILLYGTQTVLVYFILACIVSKETLKVFREI